MNVLLLMASLNTTSQQSTTGTSSGIPKTVKVVVFGPTASGAKTTLLNKFVTGQDLGTETKDTPGFHYLTKKYTINAT